MSHQHTVPPAAAASNVRRSAERAA